MPAPKDPAARELWKQRMSESRRGRKQDPESVARRAAAQRGRKHTPEALANITAAARRPEVRRAKSEAKKGEKNPNWNSDLDRTPRAKNRSREHYEKVSRSLTGNSKHGMKRPEIAARVAAANTHTFEQRTYTSMHTKMRREFKGKVCVECGAIRVQAALMWRTMPLAHVEWDTKLGCPWSRYPEDYVPMCVTHHTRYDADARNADVHPLVERTGRA